MTSCAARVACGAKITEEFLARVHALSRIAASQLPTILRGATCFADWHVDAVNRAALSACIPAKAARLTASTCQSAKQVAPRRIVRSCDAAMRENALTREGNSSVILT